MIKEVATALLRVGDGSLVLQRRRGDHPKNPGLLGLFGGHLDAEDHLDPETALARELSEETSLRLGDLTINRCESIFMPESAIGNPLWYHMHDISLPSACFEVYDGSAETVPADSVTSRTDLEPAIVFAFKKVKEFNGS